MNEDASEALPDAGIISRRKGVTVPDTVLYDKDGHIVTITYHRPERMNAINGEMRDALNTAWLHFRDDLGRHPDRCWPCLLRWRRHQGRGRRWHFRRDLLGETNDQLL